MRKGGLDFGIYKGSVRSGPLSSALGFLHSGNQVARGVFCRPDERVRLECGPYATHVRVL